ncbi:hypothetical protein MTO96_024312 [Rhipicephalus appendiculatus]
MRTGDPDWLKWDPCSGAKMAVAADTHPRAPHGRTWPESVTSVNQRHAVFSASVSRGLWGWRVAAGNGAGVGVGLGMTCWEKDSWGRVSTGVRSLSRQDESNKP